jgi:hypothetical protein
MYHLHLFMRDLALIIYSPLPVHSKSGKRLFLRVSPNTIHIQTLIDILIGSTSFLAGVARWLISVNVELSLWL